MKRPAFTLIEMVVVVAIIGLLAASAVLLVNRQRVTARESRRIADAVALNEGVLTYETMGNNISTLMGGQASVLSTSLTPLINSGIMTNLPSDPLPADVSGSPICTNYSLYAPATGLNWQVINFKGVSVGIRRYAVFFGSEMKSDPLTDNVHPMNRDILLLYQNNTGDRYIYCNNKRHAGVVLGEML